MPLPDSLWPERRHGCSRYKPWTEYLGSIIQPLMGVVQQVKSLLNRRTSMLLPGLIELDGGPDNRTATQLFSDDRVVARSHLLTGPLR